MYCLLFLQLVGVSELKRLHPFLNTDGLEGAVWVPEDAVCDPQAICYTLAKLSADGGEVRIAYPYSICVGYFLSELL